jgi:thiamine biosynthesis lipoprotein
MAASPLALAQTSSAVRASYERANEWRIATGGLFSAERPEAVLDLNGIVKAEAIDSAGALLDRHGCTSWSINVGGDLLVRSDSQAWMTGIADPANEQTILCTLTLADSFRAVATSGSAQRGDHIWTAGSLLPSVFVQVSVLATDIVTADVLATAIVAGGMDALDDTAGRWPVEVLTVDRSGEILATLGFRALAVRGRGAVSE